ncbi:hypothetical protein [Sulfuracidifex tepidarius]|uniref:Uncharacterized protein n=1 Tax=Sulfuracidifex tepidarius TaxID=1294262 RepID=A0A510E1T2_9CREN|nr:hypothetical protein [Sulfuracidifex tepidarius]BBG26048.1 hypothetical protein IC007_0553 [Sulfuracidifex tepidarius]
MPETGTSKGSPITFTSTYTTYTYETNLTVVKLYDYGLDWAFIIPENKTIYPITNVSWFDIGNQGFFYNHGTFTEVEPSYIIVTGPNGVHVRFNFIYENGHIVRVQENNYANPNNDYASVFVQPNTSADFVKGQYYNAVISLYIGGSGDFEAEYWGLHA